MKSVNGEWKPELIKFSIFEERSFDKKIINISVDKIHVITSVLIFNTLLCMRLKLIWNSEYKFAILFIFQIVTKQIFGPYP